MPYNIQTKIVRQLQNETTDQFNVKLNKELAELQKGKDFSMPPMPFPCSVNGQLVAFINYSEFDPNEKPKWFTDEKQG
jgi:16S rRNA A1518/A1519 N6-dimethyltransferase RsmA/KsgA/DIM1 with predicted DNA glycosylase/AP lyase activity